MARILIDIPQVEAANLNLKPVLSELEEHETSLMSIQRGLSADVRNRCGINGQLTLLRRETHSMRRQITQLLHTARAGVDAYRTAEYHLSHSIPNWGRQE